MGSDVNEVLQQAMEFYVAGHTVEAKALLLDLVRAHPSLEAGWMFLSYTLDDPIQKADCLRQVLKLNPQNTEAKGALAQLVPLPRVEQQPAAPASAHASAFTVDISHANDNLVSDGLELPLENGQPAKVVPAFTDMTEVQESAPITAVRPKSAGVREPAPTAAVRPQSAGVLEPAPITAVRPRYAGVPETMPTDVSPPAAAIEEVQPGEKLTAAPKKPGAASAKPGSAPPAAGEAAKPKKRGNTGCTCVVLVVVALLIIAAVGAGLFLTGNLPGFSPTAQATGIDTAIPSETDTPLLLTLPPRWTDTPPPTITYTPTISMTPTPTPTPSLVPPDETQLASIAKVEKQVADLRGLQWDGSPPIYVISRDQAESILQASLAQSGYAATIGNQQKVLVALGMIPATYDLSKYALSRLSDGVLGFYMPFDKTIYVIGTGFGGMARWTFSHEFDHALVNHFYPAVGMMDDDPACVHDSQHCEAVRALVEGDATLLMYQWYTQYATPSDKQDISNYRLPFGSPLEDNPPPYFGPDVDFSYTAGMNFVYALWQKGNWAEVDKAYDNLPVSTEQILHPDKYLKGELPVVMTVPDLLPGLGSQWTLVGNDSLGEFMTYLLLAYGADNLSQIPQNDALTASAGWGGDHYLVYASAAGDQTVLAAEWIWDSDKDAAEFLTSMKTYLDKRFRGEKVSQPGSDCWSKNSQTTCVYHVNKKTLWILAPGMDTVKTVLTSYPAYS